MYPNKEIIYRILELRVNNRHWTHTAHISTGLFWLMTGGDRFTGIYKIPMGIYLIPEQQGDPNPLEFYQCRMANEEGGFSTYELGEAVGGGIF